MSVNVMLPGATNLELVRTIMNIYLYGELERPEYFGDHIRSEFERSIVTFDSAEFMTTGPGRFIEPAMFTVVQRFFSGEFNDFILASANGSVSGLDLINALPDAGFSVEEGEFIQFLEHFNVGSESGTGPLSYIIAFAFSILLYPHIQHFTLRLGCLC